MTADWARLPHEILERTINEVPGANPAFVSVMTTGTCRVAPCQNMAFGARHDQAACEGAAPGVSGRWATRGVGGENAGGQVVEQAEARVVARRGERRRGR
jgi:hypothetical protein